MAEQPRRDPQDVEAHMPFKYRRDEAVPTEEATGSEPEGREDDVEAHRRNFRHGQEAPPEARR